MVPVVGDWGGTGVDTVGLYNPTTSMFFLKDSNSTGFADTVFVYGAANQSPAAVPLGGNWTAAAQAEMAAVQVTAAQLPAVDPSAVDRIDLSTMVEHEFGNVAGLADLSALAGDVMSGVAPAVDHAFA